MKHGKKKKVAIESSPKKPYRTPKLIVYGTVDKITTAAPDDFNKQTGAADCFLGGHIFKQCGAGDFFHEFS